MVWTEIPFPSIFSTEPLSLRSQHGHLSSSHHVCIAGKTQENGKAPKSILGSPTISIHLQRVGRLILVQMRVWTEEFSALRSAPGIVLTGCAVASPPLLARCQ